MAANALDIVTLAQARTAFRVIGEDAAHDALIASFVYGAAQWIETLCVMGIVDAPQRGQVRPPEPDGPFLIEHRSYAVRDVRYREPGKPDVPFDVAPAGDLSPDRSVPAFAPNETPGRTAVLAPMDGWPAATLDVEYTLTTPAQRVPGALRAAMLMLAAAMYDNRDKAPAPASWTVLNLIAPYRDFRVGDADVPLPTPNYLHTSDMFRPLSFVAGWSATVPPDESDGEALREWLATLTLQDTADHAIDPLLPPAQNTGHMYLNVWVSDGWGGDPITIRIGGSRNLRDGFTRGNAATWRDPTITDRTARDRPGWFVRSVDRLNTNDLSGEALIVGG